jgi:hypothetical protein
MFYLEDRKRMEQDFEQDPIMLFFEKIIHNYILYRRSEHKKRENVLDWELTDPDRPAGGLYSHPSLKIPIIHHTDIALPRFVFTPSEQDILAQCNF